MPKIGNNRPASEIPCDRCHSKRKIAKTWTEKIKNDHGYMTLFHSQIICTNKECQSTFEKIIQEDILKRERLKQVKADDMARRVSTKTS